MAYNERCTKAWQLYEIGRKYNQSLEPSQYDLVNTNIEFFIGNQWRGLSENSAMSALPKPVFNIIKRISSLFVANLTSSATKVTFEPLANADVTGTEGELEANEAQTAADMANSEIDNLFDKLKMDFRIRDALFDGVQTGDYCAHFYFDPQARPYGGAYSAYRGEIQMELVDGVNVMFGNPNTPVVEKQPYILVIGRDTVDNLRAEYNRHHKDKDADSLIRSDKDYLYQAGQGGKLELVGDEDKTGKAIFMYYYTKKTKEVKVTDANGDPVLETVLDENGQPVQEMTPNGFPMFDTYGMPVYKKKQVTEMRTTVWVSKHTKMLDIFEEIDTGLTYYPIAWGNWQKQKNIYHGRSLVTEIIPNQIYINSMFALIMRHQQMLGFPKVLYDSDVIGQWNNAVGQAIAVRDLPPDKRMSDLHSVIQPADMSTQIMGCIERAMQYTKECLGATDAQLGNVNPENTSAIIALQSSSQVPLENPQANKYEWVEDIGRILLDMMGTYYGKRPVVRHVETTQQITDPTTGMPSLITKKQKVVELYDFSKLKHLWLNVRADVGASTYWSRIAIVQTLDNLKQAGVLDVIDYIERMPDEYIPKKEELVAKFKKQLEQAPQAVPTLDPNSPANPIADVGSLPTGMQEAYQTMGTPTKNMLRQQATMGRIL